MSILIIDDSQTSRMLLESILRNSGYDDVVQAESAAEGIRFLENGRPEGAMSPVEIILMDLMMPEMDGIEATRFIKNHPDLGDIPVVMVTVNDEADKLEQAFGVGATDYITKPVHKIELRARVRSVLKLKSEMDRRKARERELMDMTARLREANIKLERLSSLDGLTGIPNRRSFDAALVRECRRVHREGEPISLLLLDVDRFKNFNDTYGHQEGDACLRSLAKVLEDAARRPGDLCARFGGEEFVILLPNVDAAGAMQVAEAIRNKLRELHIVHSSSDVADQVTVSIGLAVAEHQEHKTPELLVGAADKALYDAKTQGRDRICQGGFS